MKTIRIVLAEDHQIVRQGVRLLLEAQPGFSVVGEAGEGVAALRLLDQLQPDILVLDLVLPALGGFEVLRQASRRAPATRVVVLSMHHEESYVLEAFRAGAAAYVRKSATAAELIEAVHRVLSGRRYLSPAISESALQAYLRKTSQAAQDPYDMLTAREREVLELVAAGRTNAEAARLLCLSPRTVEIHRANMMRKLNLRTHIDLVRYAIARGILPMAGAPPSGGSAPLE